MEFILDRKGKERKGRKRKEKCIKERLFETLNHGPNPYITPWRLSIFSESQHRGRRYVEVIFDMALSRRMANGHNSAYLLIPELGDLVTFVSDIYKSTTGRIVFRSGKSIRIKTSSTTATEFPLDDESGLFLETLGVTEILIHEKRKSPHYSKQLSAIPGDIIECYDAAGHMQGEPRRIRKIIATDVYDAIEFDDGTVLDFQFIGPPEPFALLRARAAPEQQMEAENYSMAEDMPAEVDVPDVDFDLLPAPLVSIIPTEDRTYSDSIQREEMFISLLMDIPASRQKDPKIMRRLYHISDLLLALKNSVITRDASGAAEEGAPPRSYIASSLQDALRLQPNGQPISTLVPIAAVKKALYTDDSDDLGDIGDFGDVEIRSDLATIGAANRASRDYLENPNTRREFVSYISSMLDGLGSYVATTPSGARISIDQDVLRSQIPQRAVRGFNKLPGVVDSRGSAIRVTAESLGSIQDRYVRLLSGSSIRNPKTNTLTTVAHADTADTVGHVFLTPGLADLRSPTRSNVLLWDIQASERSRVNTKLFFKTLKSTLANQRVIMKDEAVPIVDQLRVRMQPSLALITQSTTTVLDSVGLRNLELTEELMSPLAIAVLAGKTRWDAGYARLQVRALEAMKTRSVPAVENITGHESVLFSKELREIEEFKEVFTEIRGRERSLRTSDLALASALLTEANATLGPYWYGAIASELKPAEYMEGLRGDYMSESSRITRNIKTARETAAKFAARPTINKCPHVKEYERAIATKNDNDRMRIFNKFLNKYQAGQRGNYILCNTCNLDLVCKHEVLLLNEFMNPGRSEALHKALLLEYSGQAFEGAYICKTCGQKIQEIEYDSHIEFDDAGRPLVGRSVIVADEDGDEADDIVIRAVAEASISFKDEARIMYFNQRILFEQCGAIFDMEVYNRTVPIAMLFRNNSIRNEAAYTALVARARGTAPSYSTYYNNKIVGIIGALAVLELQTSTINIPVPTAGCKFDRSGFPLDGLNPAVAGSGALHYVACALAQINRDNAPWNGVGWNVESKIAKRVEEAEKEIVIALSMVLAVRWPIIDGITLMYQEILRVAKERKTADESGTSAAMLASVADKLPPPFRPQPRIKDLEDERPIGNLAALETQIAKGDTQEVKAFLTRRQRELNQTVMRAFHTASEASGLIRANDPCSESICCFTRLAAVDVRGFGIASLTELGEATAKEVAAVTSGMHRLEQRDPSRPNTGTHIYVPWSAPASISLAAEADASIYYKLFLKMCFRGTNYGLEHEFGRDYSCRRCAFQAPPDIFYAPGAEISETDEKRRKKAMDDKLKEREDLSLSAFHTQGIEINHDTFSALEDKIRSRKTIPRPIAYVHEEFEASLGELAGAGAGSGTVMLAAAVEDWAILTKSMIAIKAQNAQDLRRKALLEDFYRRYGARKQSAQELLALYISAPKAEIAMQAILKATESSEASQNIRNLINLFVVGGNAVAHEFKVDKPPSRKWFPKITRSHAKLLQDIWAKFGSVRNTAIDGLDELEDDERAIVNRALMRMADWYGPWLTTWRNKIRPGHGFTPREHVFVSQWSAFVLVQSLLTPASPLYADAGTPEGVVRAIKFIAAWLNNSLVLAQATVAKYQLTPEEVLEQVNARTEKEKNMFIKKFDVQEMEMRKLELMKKKLKMGDWSIGSANRKSYNPELLEIERTQQAKMGLPEFSADVVGEAADAEGDPHGFYEFGVEESNMSDGTLHRAAQDEDEGGADGGSGDVRLNIC